MQNCIHGSNLSRYSSFTLGLEEGKMTKNKTSELNRENHERKTGTNASGGLQIQPIGQSAETQLMKNKSENKTNET